MTDLDKILCLCLIFCARISAQLDVGDACGATDDKECRLVTDCPEAVEKLKRNQPHGLQRCGFQKVIEIVCCTKKDVVTKLTLRSSVEACERYFRIYEDVGTTSFIIRGVNASLGEFPYMAALGYEATIGSDEVAWGECGGVLISDLYVLTAAHCLVRVDSKALKMVRLGKVDLLGDEDGATAQDIPVVNITLNPEYNHIEKLNDIALVKLGRPVQFSENVKPVCLHQKEELPPGLIIAGWGVTKKDGQPSRFLLKAFVKPVDLKKCNQTYLTSPSKKPIFSTQLCALSPEDLPSDTCQGDSGGPIQVQNTKATNETPLIVVGVTSFGRGCGGTTPSVYTRVSRYIDWIESIVWP